MEHLFEKKMSGTNYLKAVGNLKNILIKCFIQI
jgi:hypothetical protein